jgi:flagellar hook-associated protein 2
MYIDRLRFSGLSGIDTESMIDKLMKAERKPLNAIKQKKQLLEWKRDDYREVNKLLLELRDLARDMRYSTNFTKKTIFSSNDTIAGITASNNAVNGTYTLKVNKMASTASLTSTSPLGISNPDTDKINQTGTDQVFTLTGETGTVTITVTADDTIYTLVDKINAEKGKTGVQVSYDKENDRLFFLSSKTGENSKIIIGGTNAAWAQNTFKLSVLSDQGSNAQINLNGTDLEFDSNIIFVNGLTISLKSEQKIDDPPINLTVSNDVAGVFDNIKKFIDKYNEVIGKINDKISEEKIRNLVWPTDEEREKMKDSELELWEKNAKKGMLQRDPLIKRYLDQFREDFSTPLVGAPPEMDSLFDIGIEPGDWKEKGKLHINEDKLKAAIASNPDGVMALFVTNSADYSKSGIAQRLYANVDSAIKGIIEKAGNPNYSNDQSILSMDIKELSRKIEDFEKKLIKVENRYVLQFSQMEQALQKATAQSGWLFSQNG